MQTKNGSRPSGTASTFRRIWRPLRFDSAGWATIGIFALVAGTAVVFFYISVRGESERRHSCLGDLRQFGLALHSYHSGYHCFPPPYISDDQGKPLYSWRVLLLPYVDEGVLHWQWRLDEPWDGPHNQRLSDTVVPHYRCPVATRNRRRGIPRTDYLAVVGSGMAREAGKCLSLDDFGGTPGNTIMVVVRRSPTHWAEPVDLDGTARLKNNARRGVSISDLGGADVLFADGSVGHLPQTMSDEEIKVLLMRDGGEKADKLREAVRQSTHEWMGRRGS